MPKRYFGSVARITHCVACGNQSKTRFCNECERKRCSICKKVDTRGARAYTVDALPNDIVVFCDIHGRAHQRYTEAKPEKFRSDTEYREWLSGMLTHDTPDTPTVIDETKLSDLIDKAFDKLKD